MRHRTTGGGQVSQVHDAFVENSMKIILAVAHIESQLERIITRFLFSIGGPQQSLCSRNPDCGIFHAVGEASCLSRYFSLPSAPSTTLSDQRLIASSLKPSATETRLYTVKSLMATITEPPSVTSKAHKDCR